MVRGSSSVIGGPGDSGSSALRFNIRLKGQGRGFWPCYVLGNLHLLPARELLPIFSSVP